MTSRWTRYVCTRWPMSGSSRPARQYSISIRCVERTGPAVGLHGGHLGDDLGPCDHPADAEPRRDELGERPQADNAPVPVEGLERRHRIAGEADAPVGVVLQDEHPVTVRELDQLLAACPGERHARRVVELQNVVHELGRRQSAPLALGERRLQLVDHHAVRVHADLDEVRFPAVEHAERRLVGRPGDDDRIPGVHEELAGELDALLGAVADEDAVRANGDALAREMPGDPLAQLRQTGAGRVLERLGAVLDRGELRELGQIGQARGVGVARCEHDRAAVVVAASRGNAGDAAYRGCHRTVVIGVLLESCPARSRRGSS